MVTRVTGAPAIQEPRAGAPGGPSADLRSLQVAVQNIRERFRIIELAFNDLVVPDSTGTTSTSQQGNAAGPPGALQYTDVGGGFAGSLSLVWSPTNQQLSITGDTYFYGDLYQNGDLLTFVQGIEADSMLLTGIVALQAGSGVTISVLTGNVIEITAGAAAGVNSLNGMGGDITLQAGSGVTITPLTGGVIQISSSASAGVNSLNLLAGDITIQGDGSVTVTVLTGNVIELSASASAGVASLNALTGTVTLQGAGGTTVTVLTGNVIEISSSASGGVSSLNSLAGAVTLQAGANVTITELTGNVIEISATGGGGGGVSAVVAGLGIAVTGLTADAVEVATNLVAGTNITLTPLTGGALEISSSGSGGGVTSLNALTGPVTIQGDGTIYVTELTGNVIQLSSSGGGGVSSLNYLTGQVTIVSNGGIDVGFGTGNVIELRGSMFSHGAAPPDGSIPGDRWVQDTTGILFTYYDDGNTEQWVDFSNVSSGGSSLPLPVAIESGGTGEISAADAINALLPSQTGNSGEVLTTNGSVASWTTITTALNGLAFSTWTPTDASGSSISITASAARYVKVGKLVHFWLLLGFPFVNPADPNNVTITLPSTAAAGNQGTFNVSHNGTTATNVWGLIDAGAASFAIVSNGIRMTNAGASLLGFAINGCYEEA